MIHQGELGFETHGGGEMRDITPAVAAEVRESGIRNGYGELGSTVVFHSCTSAVA